MTAKDVRGVYHERDCPLALYTIQKYCLEPNTSAVTPGRPELCNSNYNEYLINESISWGSPGDKLRDEHQEGLIVVEAKWKRCIFLLCHYQISHGFLITDVSFPTESLAEPEMKREGCIRCRHTGGPTNKANRSADSCMKMTKSLLMNLKKTCLHSIKRQLSKLQPLMVLLTVNPITDGYLLSARNGQCCNVRRRRCSIGAIALQTGASVLNNGWYSLSHAYGFDVWGNQKGSAALAQFTSRAYENETLPCNCMTSGVPYGVERSRASKCDL
ncbi:uncharacterized protein BJ212DRAFT_1299842 [Suillus subaureus]|uniref:Uncharacterized protein n=1 Tax=Suillus subaureus TaxID=48587 RepID=A0A9P7EAU3_9AGAM|nr:uncharacterized protein BJ212DRAFT_1299842 [Suillus subaureus]KAG1815987.1 hypothetical protein BJ212DRAFT_1299842 [Suillus subaureus]